MAKYYLITFLILVTALSSCTDDDAATLDRASLIAGSDAFGKTWSIVGIEVPLGTISPKSCVADNLIVYYPNGNYEVITGRDKCDPLEPIGLTGTWALDNDETTLFIQIDDSTRAWTIENLGNNNQEISSEFTDGKRTYSLTAQ